MIFFLFNFDHYLNKKSGFFITISLFLGLFLISKKEKERKEDL